MSTTNNGNSAVTPTATTTTTQFAAALFQNIATKHQQANIIISPLIVEATLALLYLGSDGNTAEELKRALQLKRFACNNAKMAKYYAEILETFTKSTEDSQILLLQQLLFANDVAISEEFQKIAHKYFHYITENTKLNETSVVQQHIVNALLQLPLGAKISTTTATTTTTTNTAPVDLSQLSASSRRALLLNIAYFQSKWFLPFSAYRTGIYEFHLSPTAHCAVPMLFDDDMFVKFAEFKELDARAIELPYEHIEELSMLLVLPNKRDGLPELEQRLCGVDLCDLAERMQMDSVQVLLPKFSIDFEVSLQEALQQLGVLTLFTKDANFKNLLKENNSNEALPISDILHRACIEVNESGSEGSKTTTAYKTIVLSNSRQKFFRADHPFYFAVRSRDVIFFAGHVTKF